MQVEGGKERSAQLKCMTVESESTQSEPWLLPFHLPASRLGVMGARALDEECKQGTFSTMQGTATVLRQKALEVGTGSLHSVARTGALCVFVAVAHFVCEPTSASIRPRNSERRARSRTTSASREACPWSLFTSC